MKFRRAVRKDLSLIRSIVAQAGLPSYDLTEQKAENFIIAEDNEGRALGTAGFELSGADGLLRSLAVCNEAKGRGLGRALVSRIERICAEKGIADLYLLTKTAPDYFPALGYQRINRDKTSSDIEKFTQFTDTPPGEAVCMVKSLSQMQA
ncbi:acetyltransferase [Sedimentisphaera cyanobacteriorum]|uniref:Acetyltransferase n=1 Tax=Sedimentisphaera cyanobacteriorum TaxID=1940790 RepID=A0A1Q2HQX2_9BACT|nr:arsenic resistance N-acetyltransferase ArsN2 [Sedimentisphaera cyanobacteriorum]AQQ09812.1 acetyltransferase [Sedimentisphaera cyanobacteriorum]